MIWVLNTETKQRPGLPVDRLQMQQKKYGVAGLVCDNPHLTLQKNDRTLDPEEMWNRLTRYCRAMLDGYSFRLLFLMTRVSTLLRFDLDKAYNNRVTRACYKRRNADLKPA